MAALIRPRLNDYYNLPFTQEEVDFAIPFLDEDIPLYLDPFLLWKSPSMQDNSLHTAITNCFNSLGHLMKNNMSKEAIAILIQLSECGEVGLGMSKNREGLRIGYDTAESILLLFSTVENISKYGFIHFEEIQLYIDGISKDRVSDIACNFIKSFLIDYTIEQSKRLEIPLYKTPSLNIYDYKINKFVEEHNVSLPQNPETNKPILFVPKRWLRYIPWINYEDYFKNYFIEEIQPNLGCKYDRISILNYNRYNYDMVQTYVKLKERTQSDCKNDPLFKPIPILMAKNKLELILKFPSGKTDNADKKYEENVVPLMVSLLYPNLDFATAQSRTDSGTHIRDLIFYNNRSLDFLKDIYDDYASRQIVMELKNVKEIEREHINQLNRYLTEHFGKFGIIITRNRLTKAMFKNTIDLWAGQRRCIITLTDEDLKMMVDLFEGKQRYPIEVIKKKYIEFIRATPS